MSGRPKLGSTDIGRLKKLFVQPSDDRLSQDAFEVQAGSSTSQPLPALTNALAVLLEKVPPSDSVSWLLAPGTMVGRYEIVRLLGTGGMGVVYEAIDPLLQRRIALKLLKSRRSDDSERALSEARALAQITHPNVVTAFDVGQVDEITYVAMALIAGASLRRQLGIWPRPWSQLESTVLQVGRALAAAHAAGLVHCDVKPDNVLVDVLGHAYVADFGLARYFGSMSSSTEPADADPQQRRWFGTPGYVAPELVEGHDPSPQSDQFSFCVMLIEALVGITPETEPGSPVPSCNTLVTRLEHAVAPRSVKRALSRGIAATPELRFTDMNALLHALTSPTHRRALTIGLGLTAIALCGSWMLLRTPSSTLRSQPPITAARAPTSNAAPSPSVAPDDAEPYPSWRRAGAIPGPQTPELAASTRIQPPSPTQRRQSSSTYPSASPPASFGTKPVSSPAGAAATSNPNRPFGPRK